MYSFLASDLNIDGQIASLLKYDNLIVSKSFIICADEQLYHYFLKLTGLTSIKKCGISCTMDNVTYGAVSSYETSMGINFQSQWVKVCWKSKSGKIYQLHDDVNCHDIEFWLENVNVPLLYKQLYGPTTLPFKLPAMHFSLVIGSISISLEIIIRLKEGFEKHLTIMEKEVSAFINQFNNQSEKKNRKDGVVHNWKTIVRQNSIHVDMDLGSAGAAFLKKLLKWLNGIEQIEKVIVGHTPDS